MSRLVLWCVAAMVGFPRVSGDEPTRSLYLPARKRFSPRERG